MALTLGGVSLFVVIFAVIPIARPLFRKLNVPWHLHRRLSLRHRLDHDDDDSGDTVDHQHHADEVYGFDPGLGADRRTGGGRGDGGFEPWYTKFALRRAVDAGEGYDAVVVAEPERKPGGPTARVPPTLGLSLVPPAVLLVLLNVVKADPVVALTAGGAACVVLFWRRYENLLLTLNRGGTNAVLPSSTPVRTSATASPSRRRAGSGRSANGSGAAREIPSSRWPRPRA